MPANKLQPWLMTLIVALCGILLLIGFRFEAVSAGARGNLAGLLASKVILGGEPGIGGGITATLISGNLGCEGLWFQAMVSRKAGNPDLEEKLEESLACHPRYILLVQAVAPQNMDLAQAAAASYPENSAALHWYAGLLIKTEAYPDAIPIIWQVITAYPVDDTAWLMLGNALAELPAEVAARLAVDLDLQSWVDSRKPGYVEALFTLARVTGMTSISQGEALYRQGLLLKPHDGVRWRELGDLLRDSDPEAAIEAYLACCENGDPGSHGCLRAGLTAESLGDLDNAILYLRRSKFNDALEKADEIEARLKQELP